MIKRLIKTQILKDLSKKMVFLAGPRQCGKTTLAEEIIEGDQTRNLNWDTLEGRERILRREFPKKPGILVLDEIHKYAKWRNLLKGLYDSRKGELQILVTGSAKLDYYRRGGDSLQGRYHLLRMHPLTFKEIQTPTQRALERLFHLSGFPEPYSSNSKDEARRWTREYRTRLVREELTQLEKVSEISLLEELSLRLPTCVGSPLSINSLREDIGVSHVTLARWIRILENLYHIFRVYPFGAPRIKALKKESKHYHYDWNAVDEPGARFENFIALHLLAWCHHREDVEGYDIELRCFRDREQREVDFVVLQNRKPIEFIECKLSAQSADSALRYLKNRFPNVPSVQVCLEPRADVVDANGIRLCDARTYLLEKV